MVRSSTKIGFIGLGEMGGPMALNLASQYSVVAYDSCETVRSAFNSSAIRITNNQADLADTEVIFLCLPNGDVVDTVLFDSQGLVASLSSGCIVVDTSTCEHGITLDIAHKLNQAKIRFIDAPVSGMKSRAQDGTLTMMCGGDKALVKELEPLFSTMATEVLHMGDVGAGQLTKLINQVLLDINAAALAEILPLSAKIGLEPEKIAAVINSGTGRSYASEFFIPRILNNDFSQGYPMDDAYKDLVHAAALTSKHKTPTPVLSAATATYQSALLAGHGKKDKGGMVCVFEDLLGVKFRS